MPEEFDCIAQTDTSGTTTYTIDPHGDALPRVLVREKPDGSLTRYVYGIGLLYEVDDNDTATFYHYDQVGSTAALTADDGVTVTDRFEYSPYGVTTYREGSTDTPFQYNGRYGIQTDDNGLLHMRARYYHPGIRRFINADPIGFAGGMNWYQYANGNPISYVDPDGEHPVVAVALAGTAAYLGSTQFANAPGPHDPTFAGAPFADEALVASAVGPAAVLARTRVRTAVAGGRSFMKTLTGPATNTLGSQGAQIGGTGVMTAEQGFIATGTLARTTATNASNASLSASQNFGAFALKNYARFSEATFGAGLIYGAATPLEPSDANISMNPFILPFQAGNLLGGIANSNLPSFGSQTGGNLGIK